MPEPVWFKTAKEKTQSFYAYHNLPMPDSLKRKSVAIALKGGVQETVEIGDIAELVFHAKKLASKDSEVLAEALSATMQGIQAANLSPDQSDYANRLKADYAMLAMSLARRADSLALAVHDQINALDAEYRKRLDATTTADARALVFFAGNYEKMKRLLGIELDLAQFALDEYRRASDRLKIVGIANESAAKARAAFLNNLRGLMTSRSNRLESALAQFVKKANEDATKNWRVDAERHYETLARLANENLAKIKETQ